MKQEETLFSPELQKKAYVDNKEWGWRLEDVPDVVSECRRLNYAILGGQVQFLFRVDDRNFPYATCDLYWLNANPWDWSPMESWEHYSNRSCTEFLDLFNKLVEKTDFEKEGIENFDYLREMYEAGRDILQGLCFKIYPVSERRYISRGYDNLIIQEKPKGLDDDSWKPLTFASAKLKHQAFTRGWATWSLRKFLKFW